MHRQPIPGETPAEFHRFRRWLARRPRGAPDPVLGPRWLWRERSEHADTAWHLAEQDRAIAASHAARIAAEGLARLELAPGDLEARDLVILAEYAGRVQRELAPVEDGAAEARPVRPDALTEDEWVELARLEELRDRLR